MQSAETVKNGRLAAWPGRGQNRGRAGLSP